MPDSVNLLSVMLVHWCDMYMETQVTENADVGRDQTLSENSLSAITQRDFIVGL